VKIQERPPCPPLPMPMHSSATFCYLLILQLYLLLIESPLHKLEGFSRNSIKFIKITLKLKVITQM